jgi:8-oxo-dGTP diphosphatase
MKHFEVVAALIFENSEVLCVQRGPGIYTYTAMHYEFPGGKVEANESHEAALVREIQEELSLNIVVQRPFVKVEHIYPDFSVTLHSYLCQTQNRELHLHEHIDALWLNPKNLHALQWAAADLPIVDKLMAEHG